MIKKEIGILLILSSLLFFSLNFYEEKKIQVQNERLVQDFFQEEKQTSIEESYYGVLEIPKISLKRGFYSYYSSLNNVDKNIELISNDCIPGNKCSFILASHSGNSSISFFKNLDQLVLDDEAIIYYSNTSYVYILKDIQHVVKNGTISLLEPDTSELVLTTCNRKNDNIQDIYLFVQKGFSENI